MAETYPNGIELSTFVSLSVAIESPHRESKESLAKKSLLCARARNAREQSLERIVLTSGPIAAYVRL
jgi:hypothetical protein